MLEEFEFYLEERTEGIFNSGKENCDGESAGNK